MQAVAKAAQAMEKKKKEEVSVIDPAKSRNLAITLGSIKVCHLMSRPVLTCTKGRLQLSLTPEPISTTATAG